MNARSARKRLALTLKYNHPHVSHLKELRGLIFYFLLKDLSYKEKHWHEKCFYCHVCKLPLVDKPFGSKNELLYCGECYNQAFASRCDKCAQIFKPGKFLLLMLLFNRFYLKCGNRKFKFRLSFFFPKLLHNFKSS